MKAHLKMSVYETEPGLYAALARLFPEGEGKRHKWVTLSSDGAQVTFFAPTKAQDEEVQS